ncbi:MAG: primosomal protein N' [Patescibacteria group bacterium]
MHFYLVTPTVRAHSQGFFTYHSPDELFAGTVVLVEIGKRESVGVVIQKISKPDFKTKEIIKVIEKKPIPIAILDLANWLHQYYGSPIASVWQTLLPRGLQKKRRANNVKSIDISRDKNTIKLNTEQNNAVKSIIKNRKKTSLLQGITGSGKTAVYIELAKKTLLREGKSVIVLVPEIALTSQLVGEFQQHFPDVLLTHSGMSEAERHIVWLRALNSEKPQLVIGPRSALFLPLPNIGLIVIDEAHEASFKQEQAPRYLASRAARILANKHDAILILGSATPSVSDRFMADKTGNIVRLDRSAKTIGDVRTELIDNRKRGNFTKHSFISNRLIEVIEETLKNKQQVLLFHNRRGSASTTLCENCGWNAICKRCFVPMVLHGDIHKLICHVCGIRENIPTTCPDCNRTGVIHKGIGTKSIADAMSKLFPSAKIARFDGDSTADATLDKMYQDIYSGQIDIIIGTQVVAKGLDLPNLAVVGVVQADGGLILPDFAAEERVFQLLLQVTGRVGRDEKLSKIVVQTFQPESEAIQSALKRNYDEFYQYTVAKRKHDGFPPFTYLLKLTNVYKTEAGAVNAARDLKAQIQKKAPKSVQILGPSPAFYERAHGTYRWQIIVKSSQRGDLLDIAKLVPDTRWQVELDPISLL